MAEETVFIGGLRFFDKHQNAPDFVIGSMVINPNELFQWIQANPQAITQYNGQPQVKISLKRSQAGNGYAALDTFQPQPRTQQPQYGAQPVQQQPQYGAQSQPQYPAQPPAFPQPAQQQTWPQQASQPQQPAQQAGWQNSPDLPF